LIGSFIHSFIYFCTYLFIYFCLFVCLFIDCYFTEVWPERCREVPICSTTRRPTSLLICVAYSVKVTKTACCTVRFSSTTAPADTLRTPVSSVSATASPPFSRPCRQLHTFRPPRCRHASVSHTQLMRRKLDCTQRAQTSAKASNINQT